MKEGLLSDQHTVGFTLIDILVVISIITLPIALLLPALPKSRDAAMIALCAGHEHPFAAEFHTYGADNGGPSHLAVPIFLKGTYRTAR